MSQSTTPSGARYALVMLTIAYVFNFIDRQMLVILQEPIKQDMGLSDAQLGLLSGFSFALVYITAGIPIAYWADRGNRRNIVTLAVAVWSGMTAMSGLAQNYVQLLLARIGVGIGEAGGSPPAHSMISDNFPPEERATAVRAARIMGLNVAGVDILRSHHGALVMEVNSSPGLEGIEAATNKDVAGMVVKFIESNARPHRTQTKGAKG